MSGLSGIPKPSVLGMTLTTKAEQYYLVLFLMLAIPWRPVRDVAAVRRTAGHRHRACHRIPGTQAAGGVLRDGRDRKIAPTTGPAKCPRPPTKLYTRHPHALDAVEGERVLRADQPLR